MPNYCSNIITASHKDAETMKRFKEALEAGTLFETFLPLSEGLAKTTDRTEYWGTKWDVANGFIDLKSNGKEGNGRFETAWTPPIAAYEKLEQLGFVIDALYIEPGMCFAGVWSTEHGHKHYEYDFDHTNWHDDIDDDGVLDLLKDEYEVYLLELEENEE